MEAEARVSLTEPGHPLRVTATLLQQKTFKAIKVSLRYKQGYVGLPKWGVLPEHMGATVENQPGV